MNSASAVAPVPQLHRALGTLDLVLLNVGAIVGLRWLSVAAQIGPSSLTLWAAGLVTFLLPSALTVLELSSRLPGEGGVYLWSKAAFGDMHGFIAGWSYWIANLVFFPSLLLYATSVLLYVPGGSWLALADNPYYNGAASLAVLWFATLINIIGLERAKWLQNAGGIATWLVGALILCGGVAAWVRFGAATPIASRALVPDLKSVAILASFATIALAYSGLELGPILGGEIREPRRTIPRALLIACVGIALVYIAGTASLFVALPAEQINEISGVPQALAAVAARAGAPVLRIVSAVLLLVAAVGALGAWVTGTARLPFLFGLNRYLPKALGAVHPRFGSPYVALVVQGVLTTMVLLSAISGSAVREAYAVLIDMTVILTLVPLLYMFAALPTLRRQSARVQRSADSQGSVGGQSGMMLIPGGPIVCGLVSGSGFTVGLLAVLFAMVPPVASSNRALFAVKVVGGSALLIVVGLVFYFRGRRASREFAVN